MIVDFRDGSFPFRYIDVPIFHGAPSTFHLWPIANRFRACVASWKGKILSFAARSHLINLVWSYIS